MTAKFLYLTVTSGDCPDSERTAARVFVLVLRTETKTLRPALTDWFDTGMAFPRLGLPDHAQSGNSMPGRNSLLTVGTGFWGPRVDLQEALE